jgi:hypothetical protein
LRGFLILNRTIQDTSFAYEFQGIEVTGIMPAGAGREVDALWKLLTGWTVGDVPAMM